MLSESERRILAELERDLVSEARAPRVWSPRTLWWSVRPSFAVRTVLGLLAGVGCLLLLTVGAVGAALALSFAAALVWSLYRWWSWLQQAPRGEDEPPLRPRRAGGPEG